jgi:hypothetical protein
MKPVADIQLLPTHAQAVVLCNLMEHCHAAGAWLSEADTLTTPMRSAYESPTYHAGALHGLYAV